MSEDAAVEDRKRIPLWLLLLLEASVAMGMYFAAPWLQLGFVLTTLDSKARKGILATKAEEERKVVGRIEFWTGRMEDEPVNCRVLRVPGRMEPRPEVLQGLKERGERRGVLGDQLTLAEDGSAAIVVIPMETIHSRQKAPGGDVIDESIQSVNVLQFIEGINVSVGHIESGSAGEAQANVRVR